MLVDEHPTMEGQSVAHALAQSDLAREKKVALFVDACHSRYPRQCYHALVELRDLDSERFLSLLIETITCLPKTTQGSYWLCAESIFASLVPNTGDAQAWQVLETAAKRSDIGLRMEIISQVCQLKHTHDNGKRLTFLASFLDDTDQRDVNTHPRRFLGEYAGRGFPRLEVRNYAAFQIARLMDLEPIPQSNWSDSHWAAFREQIRKARQR
jgi:hypothetical protein